MNRNWLLAAAGVGGYLAYQALRPRYDFRGKHVLITGGARGLGLVMARMLAAKGARLSVCSRTAEELKAAADDLEARGAGVFAAACDVTDPAGLRRFIRDAEGRLGPVDVLVNNAGMIGVGPREEQTEADYERSLKTHFWATYHACEAVVPHMVARGEGRILTIASFGGKFAVPHLLPYCAGKFAQVGYSTGLRAELLRHGVVVTTVSPGVVRTGSHLNAEFKGRHDEEYAWFAAGAGTPGFSVSAEHAARRAIDACALGEGDVVIGLPAKLAVLTNAVAPDLLLGVSSLVNRLVLPEPGGIGAERRKGHQSRGKLPDAVTALPDRAAARNNETAASPVRP
jgi:NAD(P)-dependent dehydrogenase (short-subunit alcohol dehydrogenase family)